MILELDSLYFEQIQRNFSDMLDFAVNYLNYDLKYFYEEIFLKSFLKNKFEVRDMVYLGGHSGIEYVYDILESMNIKYKIKRNNIFPIEKSKEYWTGWILSYYYFENNFTLDEINEFLPIEKIYSLYNPYHEMDERNIKERFNELYIKNNKTKIKIIREEKNYSQSHLAEYSGVSLRTIQQYEQRQKNINKASFDTIFKLAKILHCDMKDLLEPISD